MPSGSTSAMAPPAIKMLKLEKTAKYSSCLLHVVISIVTTVFPVVILELLDARGSKTVEFEHRHHRPVKARLFFLELLFELFSFLRL